MKLIKDDLKKLLGKNTLLMSVMAFIFTFIFTFISLYITSKQNQDINNTMSIFKVDGILMFRVELSKLTLVVDKLSKKLEFLLANGVSIKTIIEKYLFSIYLATSIIILPSLILNLSKLELSLIVILNLILSTILYTLIIILTILYISNMNKINSLQIKLIFLSIIIMMVSILVYNFTNMIILYFLSKIFILGSIILFLGLKINKERIVVSYY